MSSHGRYPPCSRQRASLAERNPVATLFRRRRNLGSCPHRVRQPETFHARIDRRNHQQRQHRRRRHAPDHRHRDPPHQFRAGPGLQRIGSSPAMMAVTVIIFGRTHSTAPDMIAARNRPG